MYPMLFFSIMLFILVGFLYRTSPPSYSPAEYSAKNSLKEISFASEGIKNYITQGYGYTHFAAVHGGIRDNRHNGIDIAAAYGAKIYSESDGEVYYVGNQDKYCPHKGYGKFVMVKNKDNGYTVLYAHLSKINVALGDKIKKGDVLGSVGTTGLTTGSHLHLSVFKTNSLKIANDKSCGPKPTGTDINPTKYLKI